MVERNAGNVIVAHDFEDQVLNSVAYEGGWLLGQGRTSAHAEGKRRAIITVEVVVAREVGVEHELRGLVMTGFEQNVLK